MHKITDSVDMSLSKHREVMENREASHAGVGGVIESQATAATEQQQPFSLISFFSLLICKKLLRCLQLLPQFYKYCVILKSNLSIRCHELFKYKKFSQLKCIYYYNAYRITSIPSIVHRTLNICDSTYYNLKQCLLMKINSLATFSCEDSNEQIKQEANVY